jgi:flagellin FlaB
MNSKLKRLLKGEGGITGLETAIILIAFVVVAAVFAFTVLSAGIFSSEKGKEAVYSGLEQVSGSIEIKSSVIAKKSTGSYVTSVVFSISNVAGGEPLDLTIPTVANATCVAGEGCTYSSTDHVFVIDYRDENQVVADLPWEVTWRGRYDGDSDLEEGEVAEITVPLNDNDSDGTPYSGEALSTPLSVDTEFTLDLKPPQGGTVIMQRTTPSSLDTVMDLK